MEKAKNKFKHEDEVPTINEARHTFFDNFDEEHYKTYLKHLEDVKTSSHYRIGEDLKKEFRKKLNGRSQTDYLISKIIEFVKG
mgnify:CR=1 FL=1